MIDQKTIFYEVHNNISLMCCDDCIGADLAAATGLAISNKMRSVCVMPNRVGEIWPWLEKSKIKILSRFYVDGVINDEYVSDLSEKICTSFRDGANGAIIFVHMQDLRKFAAEISSVRDDLFFNKTFNLGLDINEIGVFDWDGVFAILNLLRCESLVLSFSNDTGDKSDFVGRIFAMLNAQRGTWTGVVNFMLGQNVVRIDQTYRLVEQLCPESISKTEFFVDNDNI